MAKQVPEMHAYVRTVVRSSYRWPLRGRFLSADEEQIALFCDGAVRVYRAVLTADTDCALELLRQCPLDTTPLLAATAIHRDSVSVSEHDLIAVATDSGELVIYEFDADGSRLNVAARCVISEPGLSPYSQGFHIAADSHSPLIAVAALRGMVGVYRFESNAIVPLCTLSVSGAILDMAFFEPIESDIGRQAYLAVAWFDKTTGCVALSKCTIQLTSTSTASEAAMSTPASEVISHLRDMTLPHALLASLPHSPGRGLVVASRSVLHLVDFGSSSIKLAGSLQTVSAVYDVEPLYTGLTVSCIQHSDAHNRAVYRAFISTDRAEMHTFELTLPQSGLIGMHPVDVEWSKALVKLPPCQPKSLIVFNSGSATVQSLLALSDSGTVHFAQFQSASGSSALAAAPRICAVDGDFGLPGPILDAIVQSGDYYPSRHKDHLRRQQQLVVAAGTSNDRSALYSVQNGHSVHSVFDLPQAFPGATFVAVLDGDGFTGPADAAEDTSQLFDESSDKPSMQTQLVVVSTMLDTAILRIDSSSSTITQLEQHYAIRTDVSTIAAARLTLDQQTRALMQVHPHGVHVGFSGSVHSVDWTLDSMDDSEMIVHAGFDRDIAALAVSKSTGWYLQVLRITHPAGFEPLAQIHCLVGEEITAVLVLPSDSSRESSCRILVSFNTGFIAFYTFDTDQSQLQYDEQRIPLPPFNSASSTDSCIQVPHSMCVLEASIPVFTEAGASSRRIHHLCIGMRSGMFASGILEKLFSQPTPDWSTTVELDTMPIKLASSSAPGSTATAIATAIGSGLTSIAAHGAQLSFGHIISPFDCPVVHHSMYPTTKPITSRADSSQLLLSILADGSLRLDSISSQRHFTAHEQQPQQQFGTIRRVLPSATNPKYLFIAHDHVVASTKDAAQSSIDVISHSDKSSLAAFELLKGESVLAMARHVATETEYLLVGTQAAENTVAWTRADGPDRQQLFVGGRLILLRFDSSESTPSSAQPVSLTRTDFMPSSSSFTAALVVGERYIVAASGSLLIVCELSLPSETLTERARISLRYPAVSLLLLATDTDRQQYDIAVSTLREGCLVYRFDPSDFSLAFVQCSPAEMATSCATTFSLPSFSAIAVGDRFGRCSIMDVAVHQSRLRRLTMLEALRVQLDSPVRRLTFYNPVRSFGGCTHGNGEGMLMAVSSLGSMHATVPMDKATFDVLKAVESVIIKHMDQTSRLHSQESKYIDGEVLSLFFAKHSASDLAEILNTLKPTADEAVTTVSLAESILMLHKQSALVQNVQFEMGESQAAKAQAASYLIEELHSALNRLCL